MSFFLKDRSTKPYRGILISLKSLFERYNYLILLIPTTVYFTLYAGILSIELSSSSEYFVDELHQEKFKLFLDELKSLLRDILHLIILIYTVSLLAYIIYYIDKKKFYYDELIINSLFFIFIFFKDIVPSSSTIGDTELMIYLLIIIASISPMVMLFNRNRKFKIKNYSRVICKVVFIVIYIFILVNSKHFYTMYDIAKKEYIKEFNYQFNKTFQKDLNLISKSLEKLNN